MTKKECESATNLTSIDTISIVFCYLDNFVSYNILLQLVAFVFHYNVLILEI